MLKASCAPYGAPVVEAMPERSPGDWPTNAVGLLRALGKGRSIWSEKDLQAVASAAELQTLDDSMSRSWSLSNSGWLLGG